MKLIILRGLPGCGKSTIAEKLSEKLNSKVVHGDFFKLEFLKTGNNRKESRKYAYNKIYEEIKNSFNQNKKIIIVEEIFNDKELAEKIKQFCGENNIEMFWFYIQRDLEKLLEAEEERERKIKNTIEDFKKLEKELGEIKDEGEILVSNNDTIEDSVSFILNNI